MVNKGIKETAKDLMGQAQDIMKEDGYLAPIMFCLDEEGKVMGMAKIHEANPDDYNNIIKKVVSKALPFAVVLIHEGWGVTLDPKDTRSQVQSPSQSPNRVEYVVLHGRDRNEVCYGITAEVQRKNDKVVDFKNMNIMVSQKNSKSFMDSRFFKNIWEEKDIPELLN